MFVLTIDQRDSSHNPDRVPQLLSALSGTEVVRPFERTAGDEVQAVLRDPAAVLATVLTVTRSAGWSCGIGCGTVVRPLPAETRAGSGAAFQAARQAVERAKGLPERVAVVASDRGLAADAQAVLTLIVLLRARRTPAGWEVVEAMARGGTQRARAAELGISPQAFSQRLAASGWRQERAAYPAAVRLLDWADGAGAGA